MANQLKEDSVRDAKATPPTIGTRDNTTHTVGNCREKGEESKEITKNHSYRKKTYFMCWIEVSI